MTTIKEIQKIFSHNIVKFIPLNLNWLLNIKLGSTFAAVFVTIELDLGPIAQRLEQQTHNLLVRGSNPCGPTSFIPVLLVMKRLGECSVKLPFLMYIYTQY